MVVRDGGRHPGVQAELGARPPHMDVDGSKGHVAARCTVVPVTSNDSDGHRCPKTPPPQRLWESSVELYDDWDGFGQRLTASGGTRFTDDVVHPVEVTTVSDGKHLASQPLARQARSCRCTWPRWQQASHLGS